MNDPGPMRFVERVGDLHTVSQRLVDAERTSSQTIRKRLALEILHDEERRTVLFAHVVQRADVWMIKLRNRAGFAVEALTELRIGSERAGENLDRDRAIEPCVARLVDLAHPSRAERGEDFVRAKARAGLEGQRRVSGLYLV